VVPSVTPSLLPSILPWSGQPGCHPIGPIGGWPIGGFRSFAPLAFHPPPPGQPVTYPLVKLSGGETYQGEWNWYNGKMHGKGTLTFPPPRDGQYTGEFRDGLRHGQGTLQRPRHPRPGNAVTDADGTYTGEWCKNQRHGQGTFTSVDGTKWTGTWCRNMKDGQFTKISPDGNEVKEEWRNNRLEGRAGVPVPVRPRTHTHREQVAMCARATERELLSALSDLYIPHQVSDEEGLRDFMCPISGEIMTDPVIAKDGHTYERNNIVEWFRERLSSPLTNQHLTSDELTPNHTLKKVIADFLATQKKKAESLKKAASMEMEMKRARDRIIALERDLREQERANATVAFDGNGDEENEGRDDRKGEGKVQGKVGNSEGARQTFSSDGGGKSGGKTAHRALGG